MRVAADERADQKNWKDAARALTNVVELEVTLGKIDIAVDTASRAVALADRAHLAYESAYSRAISGYALHCKGAREEAFRLFDQAEQQMVRCSTGLKFLKGIEGFRYCELLLDDLKTFAVLERRPRASTKRGTQPLR